MDLGSLIDRARALEERAAALYSRCGVATANEPAVAAFFHSIAREETDHARSLAEAREKLGLPDSWRTHVEGWSEALADMDARIAAGEALPSDAPACARLAAALEIELSELDELRHRLLSLSGAVDDPEMSAHTARIAEQAVHLTDDPQVGLRATLLAARVRLPAMT